LMTMASLFGPVPGGLGISVVFVGALLAATTGIVGATVVAMGLISLPAMLRNNYSQSLSTGTIAASGTLGQIIPPSIVLIILADQLASATDQASTMRKALHKASTGELSMPTQFDVSSTSAGEMFLGAFVPGLVLVGLYMIYILIYAILNPKSAPAVPYEGKYDAKFWVGVSLSLVPPLALIFLVLGSIISGIATVNQAGAIGAAGALVMAGYRLYEGRKSTYYPALLAIISLVVLGVAISNYEMNVKAVDSSEDVTGITLGVIGSVGLLVALIWSGWRALNIEDTLRGVMLETAKATSLVFIILLGAAMLTSAFRAFGGEDLVRDFLNSLPGGFWAQFIIVMAVIFFLGFFLDFIEIAVVVVPIVAPILLADPSANITAVWLGVMIGLNIQTSFLTPPFGFALFYLRGVAPAVVKTVNMYKGVIAFICLQLLALVIVGLYPQLVNYLPNRVSFTGESAPPPRNPKLQYCMEQYVGDQLASSSATVDAIAAARGLDLSLLPDDLAKDLGEAFENADKAVATLGEAFVAEEAVNAAAVDYRPLLRKVRFLQKEIREAEAELKEVEKAAAREGGDPEAAKVRVAELTEAIEGWRAEIPSNWDADYETFAKLTKAEATARNTYRRSADASYEGAQQMLLVLQGNDDFEALEGELRNLGDFIRSTPPADTLDTIKELEGKFSAIEGAGDVKSALGKARRELKKKSPKLEKAFDNYDKALAEFETQVEWRAKAAALAPGLQSYLSGIAPTIGARQQQRLNEEQALFLASCTAGHRDLSLNF
ncbi:MAG: TRAP transporter large permease subunit, partial [Pseudomonadota bacterium]